MRLLARLSVHLLAVPALAVAVALAPPASAEPILPADAAVDAIAASYERQQDTFARAESGQSFDAAIRAEDRAEVEAFFLQDQEFLAFTGRHPFEVVEAFDEHGDMGNFSGIASVGLAARLLVLRRDGAPDAEIERARDACVRAAESWHVFATIAGPGTVARGVRRVVPAAEEPTLPGVIPERVPLADGDGEPLPEDKTDTWRAPVAVGLDDWIWLDNSSKDQVSGYALAALYLWDALRNEPSAPAAVVDALADDLARLARNLMKVDPDLGIDLVVRDADGRPTTFGDLNARMLGGTNLKPLPEDSNLMNGFNAALALGIFRAAYSVSGDPELGEFYYSELIGRREYMRHAVETAGLVYLGESTNFSNVNMLAIALATLGRIENDVQVRSDLGELIDQFWDTGSDRCASVVAQPWFDVIVAGFGRGEKAEVPARMVENLGGHPLAPAFQRDRVNCDAAELAAGACIAIDGTTVIILAGGQGHGGTPVATEVLPLTIRPDTNFLWRADPYGVNAGPGNRLNPRGDWLAAYWLGRLLDRDPSSNVIDGPPPLDATPPGEGGGGNGGAGGAGGSRGGGGRPIDGAAGGDPDEGCGCATPGAERRAGGGAPWLLLAGLVIGAAAHRRG